MDKAYKARCHVCGAEHIVMAGFISGATYADGRIVHACPNNKHTRDEIRAAYFGRKWAR